MDEDRIPRLKIHAGDPLEALALSIDLDRKFTARRGTACKFCGKPFEQGSKRDIFCSPQCQNNWHTRERREKIKALKNSEKDWLSLPPVSQKKQDKWKWIAEHASQSLATHPKIEPTWAKREVEKAHQKKGTKE